MAEHNRYEIPAHLIPEAARPVVEAMRTRRAPADAPIDGFTWYEFIRDGVGILTDRAAFVGFPCPGAEDVEPGSVAGVTIGPSGPVQSYLECLAGDGQDVTEEMRAVTPHIGAPGAWVRAKCERCGFDTVDESRLCKDCEGWPYVYADANGVKIASVHRIGKRTFNGRYLRILGGLDADRWRIRGLSSVERSKRGTAMSVLYGVRGDVVAACANCVC